MANISAPIPSPTQNPRKLFPEWRLPGGMINAADAQIEKASESCERWEWGCAVLVVSAVIVEFVIAAVHPSYNSLFERLGSAIADAVIALGIVGEVIFSNRDSKLQTELRKRSNDRLKEAETLLAIAIERSTGRRLSPEQSEAITRAMRPSFASIRVIYVTGAEPQPYAHDIASALRLAGCEVSVMATAGGNSFGLSVFRRIGDPEGADRLIGALAAAGLDVERRGELPLLTLYVGYKPIASDNNIATARE